MRAFGDTSLSTEANEYAAEFIRGKIKEKVKDPEKRRGSSFPDTAVGHKRLCADSGYLSNEPLSPCPARGSPGNAARRDFTLMAWRRTGRAMKYAVVFATGFDAMTGALSIDIQKAGTTNWSCARSRKATWGCRSWASQTSLR